MRRAFLSQSSSPCLGIQPSQSSEFPRSRPGPQRLDCRRQCQDREISTGAKLLNRGCALHPLSNDLPCVFGSEHHPLIITVLITAVSIPFKSHLSCETSIRCLCLLAVRLHSHFQWLRHGARLSQCLWRAPQLVRTQSAIPTIMAGRVRHRRRDAFSLSLFFTSLNLTSVDQNA